MTKPRAHELGMSLIETLMALFIMGLASSMIILTMPQRPSEIEMETRKLLDLAETAKRSALVRGAWTGISANDQSFQIVTYRDDAWVPLQRKPVRISLEVDSEDNSEDDERAPLLLFGPTGTARADRITLSAGAREQMIVVEHDGTITLEQGL